MVEVACHCGAVTLTAPQTPKEVTECNCSICRRLGARWAYYDRSEIGMNLPGSTRPYVWGDRMLAFHRCRNCGCVTHWVSLNGAYTRMGINARMIDGLDFQKVRIRQFDGAKTWAYVDEEPAD